MDNWILCLNCGWKSCSNYNRICLIKNALGNLSGDLSSSEPLELHGAGLAVLTDTGSWNDKKSTVYFKSIMFMQESELLMLILLFLKSENRVFCCFWCLDEMIWEQRRIQ